MRFFSGPEIEELFPAYLRDESKLTGGRADLLCFPESEAEVAEALAQFSARGLPVTVSGGRTGIVGGAVPPGGGLLSLEKMCRVLDLRWDAERAEWFVRVQPGLTLAGLRRFLADPGSVPADWPGSHYYPIDPTEESSQLGGNAATDASGARSFAYGSTRRWVRSLRAVLADGTVLALRRGERIADAGGSLGEIIPGRGLLRAPDHPRPAVKNAAGYQGGAGLDPIDLFLGSEGTLGVITELELALTRRPEKLLNLMVFCPALQAALDLVEAARDLEDRRRPLAIEFFDRRSLAFLSARGAAANIPAAAAAILLEIPAAEADLEETLSFWEDLLARLGLGAAPTWIEEEGEAGGGRLSAFRHALPETVNNLIAERQRSCPVLHKLSTDFAVPAAGLRAMIALYQERLADLEYVLFGHIGESHLHANVLPRNPEELERAKAVYGEIAAWAVAAGGTISAEHGVGKLKKDLLALMYGERGLAEMRRIKAYFDPLGRLGPGNVI